MRYLKLVLGVLLLISIQGYSQRNFERLWEKVEVLELEGKERSANEIVDKIYEKAVAKENDVQLIKALLYQSKFALKLQEDAELIVTNRLMKEIEQSSQPTTKAVLHSILARFMWQYFQEHRWQIYRRTNVAPEANNDFRTWDLNTLFQSIHKHYDASIKEAELLQNVPIAKYNYLLVKRKDSEVYRPTLYDILAHRAIAFFMHEESRITKPKERFYIDNEVYFNLPNEFIRVSLVTTDTLSSQYKALKVYQELENFHFKEGNETALVDVTLRRLFYGRTKATVQKRLNLYIDALEKFHKNLQKGQNTLLVRAKLAEALYGRAKLDSFTSDRKKALHICDEILNKTAKSRAADIARNVKYKILEKNLDIVTEQVYTTEHPVKILVKYNNVAQLNFKVYKVNQNHHIRKELWYSNRDSIIADFMSKNKPVETATVSLPQQGDYFKHSIEYGLPKLPIGKYLVFASQSKEFASKQLMAWNYVQVSNLLCSESRVNKGVEIRVLDRRTGTPIVKAKIKHKHGVVRTNTLGKAVIGLRRLDTDLRITYQGDSLSINNRWYYNYGTSNYDNSKTRARSFLFLDRGIYRPGQAVYFKGIILTRKDFKTAVAANIEFDVVLYDANHKKIQTLTLKTNELGAIAGAFKLPLSGLMGRFTIDVLEKNDSYHSFDGGYTNFSVEEYKRPKFEVKFDPVKESYGVGDTVTLKGNAQAFFGGAIENANVTYRVIRTATYSHWKYYSYYHGQATQEIANGEVKTKKDGTFEIPFKAIPDPTLNKEGLPVFNYEIVADVTDISGETRSAEKRIAIGYHSLKVNLNMTNDWKHGEQQKIGIQSTNLNGACTSAAVTVKIFKLQSPKYILRKRLLDKPDLQYYTKEEFKMLFPNDPYEDEHDYKNWENGEVVYEQTLTTRKGQELPIKVDWASGYYRVEAKTKDIQGNVILKKKYVQITNSEDAYLADSQLFDFSILNKKTAKKDGYAGITMNTAANNLTVLVKGYYSGRCFYEEVHNFGGRTTINVPFSYLKKKRRIVPNSNVKFQFFVVKNNDYQTETGIIYFRENRSTLELETRSFRDKLMPGGKEKWRFTIKNTSQKKQAEVLASMYDMSLDQFVQHRWNSNLSIYDYYSNSIDDIDVPLLGSNMFEILNNLHYRSVSVKRYYDKINTFGFHLNNYHNSDYLRSISAKHRRGNGKVRKLNNRFDVNEKAVQGIVVDENNMPLPGASVKVIGSTKGMATDFEGYFSIGVKKKAQLEISYVGYETARFRVKRGEQFHVRLGIDPKSLEEVVVTAHGIRREKKALGYATTKVRSEAFRVRPDDEVAALLEGKASGVVVEKEQALMLDQKKATIIKENIAKEKKAAMELKKMKAIKTRTNLQETAFFYPHLRTNKNGDVSFEFETPEALTRWKLQLLAHTKEGVSGYLNKEVVTQKELMVIPNAPRFLRENDTIVFQSKISNLSNKSLSGTASLLLYDALTGDDITNKLLRNKSALTAFKIDQKGNTTASWKLAIPEGMQAVEYKVVAQAGNYSDGESNVLPVLSNRMLVTETMPITVSAGETETYKLKPLLENTSKTLRHHQFTLEYTTNPTWYAIQSLPYLMEFPHECAEQTFSRYYANTLGSYIVNSNPKIKEVFETWKANDQLVSKLELNEQLKQVLIAETPWVRDAQNSAEQQKRLALLFDLEKMAEQETAVLEKLKKLQFPNGAFPWFAGGRENYWITQHIVAGFGHLNKLKANQYKSNYETLLTKAIAYLDSEFILRHKKKLKYRKVITEFSYWELNYLYTRSFFVKRHPLSKELGEITALYLAHTSKDWLARSIRNKIILAMVCHRYGKKSEAKRILTNLKELAIVDKDKGMYWKANRSGWRWNEAPIETQALAIEAFAEITKDTKTVEALKIWLLNSKRKTEWETTKATTEAIYALLLQGNNWLASEKGATITVGSETIKTAEIKTVQAGSGYFKKEWKGEAVKTNMGNVVVKNESKVPQYGGLYWQYFEHLEAIKNGNQKGEIQIEKELYLKKNTDAGPQLQKITAATPIAVGDLVTMRIVLHVKEDFEFVHLKDMRASGFEPVDVLSRYHWKDGLGYYQSTKDVATHFFFDYLRKGTYVLEYDVRANNAGQFSNGISTIQSMYAPEFGSHTQGVKVLITPQR